MRLFPRLRLGVARFICPELAALEERVTQLEIYVLDVEGAARECMNMAALNDAFISEVSRDAISAVWGDSA